MMKYGDIVVSKLSYLPNAIGYYKRMVGTSYMYGSLHYIKLLHKETLRRALSGSIQPVYTDEFQYIGDLDLINYINIL